MARGVNDIHIIGNLRDDPEIRHTPNDKMVGTLRVAVGRWDGGKREEVTDWFTVTVWEQMAETAQKYLKKGSQVYIRGEMRSRQYEDKDTGKKITAWEVHAFTMQMLGGKGERDRDDDDRGGSRGRDRDDDRGRGRDRDREEPRRRASRDDDDEPKRPAARRSSRDDEDEDDDPPPPRRGRRD